jgi:hypothetical protein
MKSADQVRRGGVNCPGSHDTNVSCIILRTTGMQTTVFLVVVYHYMIDLIQNDIPSIQWTIIHTRYSR